MAPTIGPVDGREIVLLVTVALLVVYVISIGGATATAIRIGEAWRRRQAASVGLGPRSEGEVTLPAKALPAVVQRIRLVGWVVFPVALLVNRWVLAHWSPRCTEVEPQLP